MEIIQVKRIKNTSVQKDRTVGKNGRWLWKYQ